MELEYLEILLFLVAAGTEYYVQLYYRVLCTEYYRQLFHKKDVSREESRTTNFMIADRFTENCDLRPATNNALKIETDVKQSKS